MSLSLVDGRSSAAQDFVAVEAIDPLSPYARMKRSREREMSKLAISTQSGDRFAREKQLNYGNSKETDDVAVYSKFGISVEVRTLGEGVTEMRVTHNGRSRQMRFREWDLEAVLMEFFGDKGVARDILRAVDGEYVKRRNKLVPRMVASAKARRVKPLPRLISRKNSK